MDLRQLVRAFDGGRIDADTLVWRKGMPDWRRLRDVSELAERLMGADAGGKAAAPEASVDAMTSESEPPPPRQVERSKTPPANYSVNDRPNADRSGNDNRPSLTDARASGAPGQELLHSLPASVSPSVAQSDPAATLPGGSSVPPPPAKGYSATPPRARARGERASLPGGRAVPMPGDHTPIKAEVRTITQTGLAPADTSQRASAIPGASEGRPAEGTAEAGRGGAPGAANTRSRDSRVPTPAGGQRRARSSDETPAQKPSSISVPPGSISQSPPRPRGKHVVAVAVLVLALGFLVRGTLSTDPTGSTSAATTVESHPKPAPTEASPPRDERAPEPITEPAKFTPEPPRVAPVLAPPPSRVEAAAPKAPERAVSPPSAAPPPAAKSPVASVPAASQPQKPPAVAPAAALSTPRLEVRPSQPEPSAETPAPARAVSGQAEAPPAPAPVATAEPPAAAAPAAPLPPASPPAAAEPPAAAPSTVPAPFDDKLARQQMAVASFQASTCGQLGETRGAGEVRVVIESWGRVVRVTHLNQAFVGTPVGLCVMQAFQQVHVPPFQGSPQSVSGSFVIQ